MIRGGSGVSQVNVDETPERALASFISRSNRNGDLVYKTKSENIQTKKNNRARIKKPKVCWGDTEKTK
jgi:hypothetical protein